MNAESRFSGSPQLERACPRGQDQFDDFCLGVLSGSPLPELEPPKRGAPQTPRSNGCRGRVIREATAKEGFFAITVDDVDTIGVIVGVELERGAPGRKSAGNWLMGRKYHGR